MKKFWKTDSCLLDNLSLKIITETVEWIVSTAIYLLYHYTTAIEDDEYEDGNEKEAGAAASKKVMAIFHRIESLTLFHYLFSTRISGVTY